MDTLAKRAAAQSEDGGSSGERSKAYSYLRFSTPEQAKGDSHRRQTELAERYALAHGLELDKALTFEDLGVSAFKGANAGVGRLGEFRKAVEDGIVPQGSYLLVESLDRLSRQKARKALDLLGGLCDAGVNVVTLADGKVYNAAILDNDPMALMWALMVAIRANEESETKARRARAAWVGKFAKARSGEVQRQSGTGAITRRAPLWLSHGEGGWVALPDRAEVSAVSSRLQRWVRECTGLRKPSTRRA